MTTAQNVEPEAVGEFLTNLYGLEITAAPAASSKCDVPGALATYVDSNGDVKGQMLCDLAAAAKLGAALTQVPMGAVDDALESKSLPANLSENVQEVLNIAVNLLPQTERLVLKEVITDFADAEVPADPSASLKLDIQRYGSCGLFLWTDS